jgi:hypothetical protein
MKIEKGKSYYSDNAKDLYVKIISDVVECDGVYTFEAALVYRSNDILCDRLNVVMNISHPDIFGWKEVES